MNQTWLITGCSKGFGRLLCEAVLERGDRVVATARSVVALDDLRNRFPDTVRTQALDVTKPGDAAAAVALAKEAFGGLDVLVNNAGYGLMGALEEGTPEEYRPVFEVNVFGLIETTKAALPALRTSKRARIINFSSVAGLVGRGGHGYYSGTKFAVEGLSEALAGELAPLGIKVMVVEPGPFRTDFLGGSINVTHREMPEYAASSGEARSYVQGNDGKQAGDPAKAVAVILKALELEQPPLHLLLGSRAYALTRTKLTNLQADMDAWETDALATDFDESR